MRSAWRFSDPNNGDDWRNRAEIAGKTPEKNPFFPMDNTILLVGASKMCYN